MGKLNLEHSECNALITTEQCKIWKQNMDRSEVRAQRQKSFLVHVVPCVRFKVKDLIT